MSVHLCFRHNVPLEPEPLQPQSRCPKCHYATHHLTFEHCPECGYRMQIEQPEPRWHCPVCEPARQPAAGGR